MTSPIRNFLRRFAGLIVLCTFITAATFSVIGEARAAEKETSPADKPAVGAEKSKTATEIPQKATNPKQSVLGVGEPATAGTGEVPTSTREATEPAKAVPVADTASAGVESEKQTSVTAPVEVRDARAIDEKGFELTPVVFHGKELFQIAPLSELDPEMVVTGLVERMEELADSPRFRTDTMELVKDESLGVYLIKSRDHFIAAVFKKEADLLERGHLGLATDRMEAIRKAIEDYRKSFTAESILLGVIYSAFITGLLVLLLHGIKRLRIWGVAWIGKRMEGSIIGRMVQGDSSFSLAQGIFKLIYLLFLLWLFTTYLNIILSFFPWTFGVAAIIFDLVFGPLESFANTFINEIPNLFTIVMICLVTYFTLRLGRAFFNEIERGTIRFKGFYRDWAPSTYQLVRIMIVAFAAVAAFPYIPGSDTPAFKGVSLFLGVLFSLGSSSAMANGVAGMMLTYMRPFAVGDRVSIADTNGIVSERRLLSTRVRTLNNQLVVIPNTLILGSHIVNFSAFKSKGLMMQAEVTIGYDVPWRKVHALLLEASSITDGVTKTPRPFVFQTALEDFYIRYQLNVAIGEPKNLPKYQSSLFENIQDCFAKGGVEIMSPHFRQLRKDVPNSTIPDTSDIPEKEPVMKT